MPDKNDVISCLKNVRDEIVALVGGSSPDAWSSPAYEDGWTAKDVLAHIASTCGPASFMLAMAQAPGGGSGGGGSFDGEQFNRQQTAMRAGHSPQQILDEIRSTMQRDIQALEGAPDELLQKHFVAPWGSEGPVAQLIIDAANGHLGGHIADLHGSLRG
jgi:uncharacterized protein (TIGR03083 family)